MKYKVVIIDDKPLIRQALAKTIPWEKFDCDVAGEAENGLEAKELIKKIRPDLIISDIKMPGMDGLTLTEYVKEILPDTKVIIITGYQEFEYAKKALSLGVCDLVLKPIQNASMEKTIQKALDMIREQERMAQQISQSQKSRQCQFLTEIMKGRRDEKSIREEETAELGLLGKNLVLMIMRVRSADRKVVRQVKNRVVSLMENYEKTCAYHVLELPMGGYLCFALLEEIGKSARERRIVLKTCLETIHENIRQEYQASCCFAVSQTTNDVRNIGKCYQTTAEMMERCYFSAEKSILFMDAYTFTAILDNGYILQDLDQFYRDLDQMEEQELTQKVEILVEKIIKETKGDEFRIKCLLSEICITLIRNSSQGGNAEEIKKDTNEIMEDINGLMDQKASTDYLFRFICQIRKNIQKKERERNPLVIGAIRYIREHYRENLSLTLVAEYLSANPSYLSRLLKKETGQNFVDILSKYRIEQAKRLLDRPGSRVIEACEQVGYNDYTYFYQVFKRLEKISPSEYKKKSKKI